METQGRTEPMMSICRSCDSDYDLSQPGAWELTCSDSCHETLVDTLVQDFGLTKMVTSLRTGETHLVPTRDIIEKGIREQELDKYPVVGPDKK